jgi:hypothetical protein
MDRSIELAEPNPRRRSPLLTEIQRRFDYWVARNTKNGLAPDSIEVVAFDRAFHSSYFPEAHLRSKVINKIVDHFSKYPSFREWACDKKDFVMLEDNDNVRRIVILAAGHDE